MSEDEKNVDFKGTKSVEPENPKAENIFKKRLRWVISAFIVFVILAAVAFGLFFLLKKPNESQNLVEINLEEGDMLTYRVHQRFEVSGQNNRKETITSIVGLRVANKTVDGYWFLLKINTTFKDQNNQVKARVTGYYRVWLQTAASSEVSNQTSEIFQVYGPSKTDVEFIRYLHGILSQLLPSVKRDLYEDVDGRRTESNLKPESSPILPGPVRMHRQADTKQSDRVSIKNHFNRSDLVSSSSEVDLDVKYTDSVSLNKSNGMVSESNASIYEQLNFGETMKTGSGQEVSTMNVTLHSHMTRIQIDEAFFKVSEFEAVESEKLVRLMVPVNDDKVKMKKNIPATASPSTKVKQRQRRGLKGYVPGNIAIPHLEKGKQIFNTKIIGIRFRGAAKFWVSNYEIQNWDVSKPKRFLFGGKLNLNIGSFHVPIYQVQFASDEDDKTETRGISLGLEKCIPVFWIKVCVALRLNLYHIIKFSREDGDGSPSAFSIALEMEPYAKATVSAEAYASVWVLRGGVYIEGTLVSVSIPTKISCDAAKPPGKEWCLTSNYKRSSLGIEAGVFYQWRRCSVRWFGWFPIVTCGWGSRGYLFRYRTPGITFANKRWLDC